MVGVPSAVADLDPVDLSLLGMLAADPRISRRQLAREMHMSPPAIGERIDRLERAGVIRGYTVDIDWAALGYPMLVFLSVTAASDQSVIMQALHEIPEVEDIAVVTGSMDLLARVRVRDHAHLRSLMLERVWQIAGVSRTETLVSLAEMPPKAYLAQLIEQRQKEDPS